MRASSIRRACSAVRANFAREGRLAIGLQVTNLPHRGLEV
jgi:hypothetical protein